MVSASTAHLITWRDIAAALAPTLGWEKSEEVVLETARGLELDAARLTRVEANLVFGALSWAPGIVGVAARFARSRGDFSHPPRPPPSSPSPWSGPLSLRSRPPPETLRRAELVELLAPTLGDEKADDVVTRAMVLLAIQGERLTHAQANAILESLASREGIVGIAARFSQARLALKK